MIFRSLSLKMSQECCAGLFPRAGSFYLVMLLNRTALFLTGLPLIRLLAGYISFSLVMLKPSAPPLPGCFVPALLRRFHAETSIPCAIVGTGIGVLRSVERRGVEVGILDVEAVAICLSCLLNVDEGLAIRIGETAVAPYLFPSRVDASFPGSACLTGSASSSLGRSTA